VDFDGEGWKEDVAAYRDTCKFYNVPIYVERSRSGNGGHVWVFFDETVPAVKARKMGSSLLTEAMAARHEITFKAYDRMFPNQDLLPKEGVGNLIALPFQCGASKKGNSLFVNEDFVAYEDQWAYLAGIVKMTAEEVNKIADQNMPAGDTGELVKMSFDDEEEKPWEKKRPQKPLEPSDIYGDGNLVVIEANMLYLKKDCASQRALNRVKRLAAFSNPEFYKRQRMRQSNWDVPRIIFSLDETREYLGIPRGCKAALLELLNPTGRAVVFDDKRNHGRRIEANFSGELREDQKPAADVLAQHDVGVLCGTTAFGKTVIAAALIAKHQRNTLVLVDKLSLVDQWKESLGQFLEINEVLPETHHVRGRKKQLHLIGQIGAGKNSPSGIIDIATVQSLYRNNEVNEIVKDYGMVVVDESHHAAAETYEMILRAVNARYVYGLTATPQRKDGKHPLMFMHCGPALFVHDAKSQAAKRGFEHYVIPCFTNFKKPLARTEAEWVYTQMGSDIVADEYRNRQIAADVINAVAEGRNSIVLTQRKDHIFTLAALIKGKCGAHVIELDGGATAKQKKNALNTITSIPDDEQLVIIATGKYVGEGFDCPRLDTLFLAMPISWKGTLSQYAGRLHRVYPGKEDVIVYDYIDVHVAVFENMYN
jgi:superfamily II DNA or RNA helicase